MPKIFEYFGFIFYFYSNEHEPIHVHVIHGGKESIFDLIMMDGALADISVREKKGVEPLTEKDKRTAEAFIRKYHKNIIEKWVKFFVLKQSVRSTSIKKKLQGGKNMDRIIIINAEKVGDLSVCLTFNDNTKQTIDVGDFIRRHPHPQYNKYLDPRKFSRFTIENGNIVWGKNWDLIFPVEDLHAGAIV